MFLFTETSKKRAALNAMIDEKNERKQKMHQLLFFELEVNRQLKYEKKHDRKKNEFKTDVNIYVKHEMKRRDDRPKKNID